MKLNSNIEDPYLHLVKDNDTHQFLIYLILVRAVNLKDSIDLFMARNQVSIRKDKGNLLGSTIDVEDWRYYTKVLAFITPLYTIVKELKGKSSNSTKGYVNKVLIAYDLIKEYIDRQLNVFKTLEYNTKTQEFLPKFLQKDTPKAHISILQINTLNAVSKLNKY